MSTAGHVLVLCTANVCRSPTAALLLRTGLGPGGAEAAVRLGTAGTDVALVQGFCTTAAGFVGPASAVLRERHESRPVDRAALEEADLVLVMERRHRAAVVSLLPSASPRTFTLREAAALATAGPAAHGLDDLPGFVRSLHAARGSVEVPPHARSLGARLRRDPPVDPLDVPDAHEDPRTSHDEVLALLSSAVTDLVGRLRPDR